MKDTEQTDAGRQSLQLPYVFELDDGRRCAIRRSVESDAQSILSFLPKTHLESDFLNYLPGEFDFTLEQEREFLRNHRETPGHIALIAEIEDQVVGTAGARVIGLRRYRHQCELGIVVAKAHWGRGVGRKLMETLIHWGKSEGFRKMGLRVFAHNDRAIALYRTLGFVDEGRLVGDALAGDGTYVDTILMSKFLV